MKKILIAYGSIGLGHKVVAENIAAALAPNPKFEVKVLDLLPMYRGGLVSGFSKFYQWMIESAPWLWGFIYTNKFFQAVTLPLRVPFAGLKISRFREYVKREQPDLIVTCHPNATGLASYLKKTGEFRGPLITTFSDFHFQPYWVYPRVDHYLVMTQEQKQEVMKWGFAGSQVTVVGLPVDPIFRKDFDVGEIFREFGLSRQKPIILVMGGSRGWGVRITDIEALLKSRFEVQVVVVAGINPALENKLRELANMYEGILKVFGNCTSEQVAKMCAAAKILVTKPGGLTIAQGLLRHLPMVLVNPLPTMEELNLQYLLMQGAALFAKNSQELRSWVDRLMQDKNLYQELREQTKKLARPRAAEAAAEAVIDILGAQDLR